MELSTQPRSILRIGFPIMFGLLVEFIVVLCDGAFLSRYSDTSFNGAGIGGMLYISFFMLGLGLSSGAQIVIARRVGESRFSEVGTVFRHISLLLLASAGIIFLIYRFVTPSLLTEVLHSQSIAQAVIDFIHFRSWGFLSAFGYLTLVALFTGIGQTRVLILFAITTAGVNVVLDYGLIYGHWGLPEMGIQGAALASFAAETTSFVVALSYSLLQPALGPYQLWNKIRFQWTTILDLLRVSIPLVGQHFLSFAGWFVFFALIEQRGELNFQASNVIRHVYLLLFIPILGFSAVTQTYVSNLLGAGKVELIGPTVKRIIAMSLVGTLILILGLLAFPKVFLGILSESDQVTLLAIRILWMVSPALILFSITFILFAVISGSGSTREALLIESSVMALYILCAFLLTIVWPQPIEIIWASEYVYFGLLGIFSWLYLRRGTWKKKEV